MTRPLALHQLAAIEASPTELIRIASELECPEVCMFVHVPLDPMPGHSVPKLDFEIISRAHKPELLAHMRDLNVKMGNIEYFGIDPMFDVEQYLEQLELGGDLGARGIVVQLQDADDRRVIDKLGKLCERAAEFHLTVGLEFTALAPHCPTIGRAVYFIDQVAQPNFGMAIDMLNLVRSGGTAADVAALDPRYIAYAQLSDGHGLHQSTTYIGEGLDRLMPGEGDWPIREVFKVIPAATPVDVETPSRVAKAAGMSARDRARWAVTAARSVLEGVTPLR